MVYLKKERKNKKVWLDIIFSNYNLKILESIWNIFINNVKRINSHSGLDYFLKLKKFISIEIKFTFY